MRREKILIIGANGQIGSVLYKTLLKEYADNQVIASDIRPPKKAHSRFETLDVLDLTQLAALIDKHQITQIYHLAAILSANAEQQPKQAWNLNMNGLFNVLNVAKEKKINKVFFPSSIAVFGPDSPKKRTPQNAVLSPTTVYGISKVAGESWCNYYWRKYNLDVRSVRFPGVIGHQTIAGGGTTDYAVEIFHAAIKGKKYTCFLKEDTYLPMLYMPDAIDAILQLMSAPASSIKLRTSYNLAGTSFSPKELATEIQNHIPNFKVNYQADFRQAIADSWPNSIDDTKARKDWNWSSNYNLAEMTADMIKHLKKTTLQTSK